MWASNHISGKVAGSLVGQEIPGCCMQTLVGRALPGGLLEHLASWQQWTVQSRAVLRVAFGLLSSSSQVF